METHLPPEDGCPVCRISMQRPKDDQYPVKVDRRRCAKCGTVKLAKCFYRNKWAITGLHHYCRTCEALRQKVYSKSRAAMARVKAASAATSTPKNEQQEPANQPDCSICIEEVESPRDAPDRCLAMLSGWQHLCVSCI